jgi:hypothetical protein
MLRAKNPATDHCCTQFPLPPASRPHDEFSDPRRTPKTSQIEASAGILKSETKVAGILKSETKVAGTFHDAVEKARQYAANAPSMTATPRTAFKKARVQTRTHIEIRALARGSCAYLHILHAALEQPPTVNLGIIFLPIIDQIHDSVQHTVVLEESEGILLVPECDIAHDIAHYLRNLGISSLDQ